MPDGGELFLVAPNNKLGGNVSYFSLFTIWYGVWNRKSLQFSEKVMPSQSCLISMPFLLTYAGHNDSKVSPACWILIWSIEISGAPAVCKAVACASFYKLAEYMTSTPVSPTCFILLPPGFRRWLQVYVFLSQCPSKNTEAIVKYLLWNDRTCFLVCNFFICFHLPLI